MLNVLRDVTDEVAAATGCWDAARIQRVLDNLLGNAITYRPGGTIAVGLALADGPRRAVHPRRRRTVRRAVDRNAQ